MGIKIALAGNPNSGKTTLFNSLTGSSQYVGNWPGVTVEKKEGRLKGHKDVTIVDLPGIYSLSPYTLEEVVTRDFLIDERPDVLINIIDASNIERNLYLTTQLLEVGIPVIIALNMIDIIQKNGDRIDVGYLSKALGCEVVEISALKEVGVKEVTERAISIAGMKKVPNIIDFFSANTQKALKRIKLLVESSVSADHLSFYAIKLFERDKRVSQRILNSSELRAKVENVIAECEKELDDDSESIITDERYSFISKVVAKSVKKKNKGLSTSDKIDSIVTNRWFALPIFAAIMWFVYYASSLGKVVTDWTTDDFFGGYVTDWTTSLLQSVGAADWLSSLILDGIIGGVGAVLGFIPQMLILFFFLSILEDCGYMTRVAFIMDRIFRKFGLSGKSFIPMLIGSGCSVPGIMASRTIENEKDRRMTIMVTSFIPCSAKLPIIVLVTGAFFPGSSFVAPSMYFLGISMVIVSGIILKKTRLFTGDPAPFVMELPQYHIPAARGVITHMLERGKSFITKAGTIIFVASGAIWFLSNFSFGLAMVDVQDSILSIAGNAIAPFFAPLGFDKWEAAVATITGLVAKENLVGTFGILFGLGEATQEDSALLSNFATIFTGVSAYSFMIFNLLCVPCFAAVGAIKREMGSWKWTLIALGYQTTLAYVISLITYQLGRIFFLGESFGAGTIAAILLIILIIVLMVKPYKKTRLNLDTDSNQISI